MEWEAISQRTLRWVQPRAFHHIYELRAGEQPVGSLQFERDFSSAATAKLAAWVWNFEREGFWSQRIRVRQADSTSDLAEFRQDWRGNGVLTLADGSSVAWKCQNFWGSEWAFLTPSDQVMVGFKNESGLKLTARVALRYDYVGRAETPLLVALGCYLLVLRRRKRQQHAAGA
jgi:hypothetical protein